METLVKEKKEARCRLCKRQSAQVRNSKKKLCSRCERRGAKALAKAQAELAKGGN